MLEPLQVRLTKETINKKKNNPGRGRGDGGAGGGEPPSVLCLKPVLCHEKLFSCLLFRVLQQINGGVIGKLRFQLFIGEVGPGMLLLELLASNGLGRTCWMFAMILSPLFLGGCSMGCLLPTPRDSVIPLRFFL